MVDALAPYKRGGKIGLFGGAGVGKTVFIMELIDNIAVLQDNLAESKVSYGQMNEPPGARMRVVLSALTVAEYFRDVIQQDVLLFIDNTFRFVQAGSEVSALLGRLPIAVVYQPYLGDGNGLFSGADHLHRARRGKSRWPWTRALRIVFAHPPLSAELH